MIKGIELILLAVLTYWVRPQKEKVSEIRTMAWRFALANLGASLLHIVRPQLEILTGINQLGWVLEYLVGCLLFFYIYTALAPTRSRIVMKWLLLPASLLIILTFIPASKEPLEILEVTSVYSYMFRLVAYSAWMAFLFLIGNEVRRWPASLLSSLRTRWRGVNLTVNYLIIYLSARLLWMTLNYLEIFSPSVEIEQIFSLAELVARASWITLYIPASWYVWIDYLLKWPINAVHLPRLKRIEAYLQYLVRRQNDEPVQYHLFANSLTTYLFRIDLTTHHLSFA
jgi:hypothetical protein